VTCVRSRARVLRPDRSAADDRLPLPATPTAAGSSLDGHDPIHLLDKEPQRGAGSEAGQRKEAAPLGASPKATPTWRSGLKATARDPRSRSRPRGPLFSARENEAFSVAVRREAMTEDDILNGRLIIEVGVAPVQLAEFVVFRIFRRTQESKS
jgi:hypothetical protein